MNRTIKFRGKDKQGEWQEGHLLVQLGLHYILTPIWETYRYKYVQTDRSEKHEVDSKTIGQFTGLFDKNGVEIYEGDLVSFYKSDTKCINPGCDVFNLIYESYIQKVEDEVSCEDGMFSCDGSPLAYCGISDLDDIREYLGVLEEDGWSDVNGNIIDEHILGIEVIGNKFDNPDLIK